MKYKLWKLKFKTPVHFGQGNLIDNGCSYMADSMFSALILEALREEGRMEELFDYAKTDKLRISDLLPYIEDELYLPKPMYKIEAKDEDDEGSSVKKKAYKKLAYVPVGKMADYMKGNIEPGDINDKFKKLGKGYLSIKASITQEEETLPYPVGEYVFKEGSGLYMIVGYEDEKAADLVEKLLKSLSYTGIGGKLSSGLGKFIVEEEKMPQEYLSILDNDNSECYMTLSTCLPQENELKEAMEGATYSLVKRSGFVKSLTFAEELRKKKDIYLFKTGACFKKKFVGDIYDVALGGNHPVYRYAKPLFVGVK